MAEEQEFCKHCGHYFEVTATLRAVPGATPRCATCGRVVERGAHGHPEERPWSEKPR